MNGFFQNVFSFNAHLVLFWQMIAAHFDWIKTPAAACFFTCLHNYIATQSWEAAFKIHCILEFQIVIESDILIRRLKQRENALWLASSMSWLISYTALWRIILGSNVWSTECASGIQSKEESTSLLLACDYLQQQPAGAGSLCSSPPHPAGRPPRLRYYPATTVEGMEGDGEGGRGKQIRRESRGEKTGKGDGVLQSGLATGTASTVGNLIHLIWRLS